MDIFESTYHLFINPEMGRYFEGEGMNIEEISVELQKHTLMFNLCNNEIRLARWAETAKGGEKWFNWYQGMPEVTVTKDYKTIENIIGG